jgi:hypothetical protein
VDELAILPINVGVDQHVLDRTVPGPQASLIVTDLFAGRQAVQNVLDHLLIGVKLGDQVPDILVGGVPQQRQLRLVGPENPAVCADPVNSLGRVLEEVAQLALTASEPLFDPPALRHLGLERGRLLLQPRDLA